MSKKALGSLIRSARQARGESYYDLADHLGVKAQTVNMIETGKNYPSLLLACKLVRRLYIDPRNIVDAVLEPDNVEQL